MSKDLLDVIPIANCPACWAAPELLGDRWDPSFVQTDGMENLRTILAFRQHNRSHKLATLGSLSSLIVYGATPRQSSFQEGEALFLTADPIGMFDIAWSTAKRITQEQLQRQPKSQITRGDLLLTIKGKIGTVHVIHDLPCQTAINQDVAKIRIQKEIDPHYVALYFMSRFGQVELRRRATGTINAFIGLRNLESVPIPLPGVDLQRRLGNMVRAAIQARESSSQLLHKAEQLFHQSIHMARLEKTLRAADEHPWIRVPISELHERWDAEFFQRRHIILLEHLQPYTPALLEALIEKPRLGKPLTYVSDNDESNSIPVLTGSEIDPYRIKERNTHKISSAFHAQNLLSALEVNDIVLTVTGPPLGEAALIRSHHLPCNINKHVVKITARKGVYPGYLTLVFNSLIGQIQAVQWCRGIRQKDLYPQQILRFIFPLLQEEIMQTIDGAIKEAEDKQEEARRLLRQAKQEVEDLIEGRQSSHFRFSQHE